MQHLDFYKEQSRITEPGEYVHLYDAIPDDIEGICKAVQNVVVHFFADPHYTPPKERLSEVDTRYTPKILKRILELDERPLIEARSVEDKFIGCCRDFTVLTVSILRHKGIPARARYGTSAYFEKGYYIDHVIVEYWNGERWVGVDAQLSSEKQHRWDFDIRDVPRDQFVLGGRGWQLCREEGIDPDLFGLGSTNPNKGWGFITVELMLDLAALNREEHLCWETWSYSRKDYKKYSEDDKAILDKVALVTQKDDNFEEWRELFQQADLKLPDTVYSWTPAANFEDYPVMVKLKD